MSTINAYLSFDGNCRSAMKFYQKCLGGELSFQTIGESPLSAKMPAKMKKCILQSKLRNGKLILLGSDMVPGIGLLKGNSVSLILNCRSEKEIRHYYNRLSVDGEQTHPLKDTYWGALCGGLTDKFGHCWILNYNKTNNR